MYRDTVQGLDACMTHSQIIDALHDQLKQYVASDREANNGFLS